ncbi:MAG: hypothetical protein WCS17_12775 [Prevotella sp.]
MESVAELVKIEADSILHKPFILEGHEDIVVKPITIGQMIEINPQLIALQEEDEGKKIMDVVSADDFHEALKIVNKYMPIMISIIDVIIGKGKGNSLTPDEVLVIFIAITKKIQTQSFLRSITLIQRLSLNSKEGIIASRKYITGLK